MKNTLEEIKLALSKCTQGEWSLEGYEVWKRGKDYLDDENPHIYICDVKNENNAIVVANSPQWISDLIMRVEQLERQLNAVNEALKDSKSGPSLTSDELIAWLYSTLPFLEEE